MCLGVCTVGQESGIPKPFPAAVPETFSVALRNDGGMALHKGHTGELVQSGRWLVAVV